jgi:hypothetical protein
MQKNNKITEYIAYLREKLPQVSDIGVTILTQF